MMEDAQNCTTGLFNDSKNPKRNMKLLFLLFFLISFSAFSQNHDEKGEIPKRILYVSQPNSNDSLCIKEIERAKKDYSNGILVFCEAFGFLDSDLRYEFELKELCLKNEITFQYVVFSDSEIMGQTQGCYMDYMDKLILETHGINFKKTLHKKADSLYLIRVESKNTTVLYWDCDEKPHAIHEIEGKEDFFLSIIVNRLDIKEKMGESGGWPFLDIGFTIEKDSTISDFCINDFSAQKK